MTPAQLKQLGPALTQYLQQFLFWLQQLHRTSSGRLFFKSIGSVVEGVESTNERPNCRCQRATLRTQKVTIAIWLMLDDSPFAVRPENVFLPEWIFFRLIISRIGGRAEFRKVRCRRGLGHSTNIAERDENVRHLTTGGVMLCASRTKKFF